MTGISDIARSVRYGARRSIFSLPPVVKACASLGVHLPSEDILGSMPLPKDGFFQEKSYSCDQSPALKSLSLLDTELSPEVMAPSIDEDPFTPFSASSLPAEISTKKWGLLLPICCRETNGGAACFLRLDELVLSLDETVAKEDRSSLCILVAIDEHDPVFDCDEAKSRVKELFGVKEFHDIKIVMLRSHYRGKLCR